MELPLREMELSRGGGREGTDGEEGSWRLGEVELGEEGMWVEVVEESRAEDVFEAK